MRKLAILFGLLVALFALLVAAAGWSIHRYMNSPIPLAEAADFAVRPGNSLREVANRLYREGLISEPEFFHWYSRLLGKADKLRAGEYRVLPGTTPAGLLDQLVAGAVLMHSLTIVEGWTFAQMLAAVRAHPAILPTPEGADAGSVMRTLGEPGRHPEGLFFPDTYRFPRDTTDLELLRQAHALMQEKLAAAWRQRSEDLPLETPYEALILASIIEKETGLDEERGQISGVFVRRLRRGMRLQTDPTVIYGMGQAFDGNLRRRDLRRDTPYNTYTRPGLPPTPIALPGASSLLAAVQPEDGNALYFVATGRGDGSHYFSATVEEHNRAVRRYLEILRQRE